MREARARAAPGIMLVGVIGSPIAHSLSPLLHETAFRALGLGESWQSFAFEIPPGSAAAALDEMREAAVAGLSVTMPHKADAAALVDECSAVARDLHAVNCVVNRDGSLYGDNTDGEGFLASLSRAAGFDASGRRCLVAGAGGAARAVVRALADAGAAQVVVVNRTPERAGEAAALAGPAGASVAPEDVKSLATAVEGADLVVNATPLGMEPATTLRRAMEQARQWLVPPELFHPGQVAADLVYVPRRTPWLVEAEERGATPVDGLGMLVHQAAGAITRWTGREAPVEAMWQAAVAALPDEPN
jgi:shikimate dehydrogenase